MQPLRSLEVLLHKLATPESYLFSLADLSALLPELSTQAFKMVVNRAVKNEIIHRFCHGLYLFSGVNYRKGLELHHAAAKLRAGQFNYLSQESVLSEAGAISQVPLQRITLMTSGRTSMLDCGQFGIIEFTHTKKSPDALLPELTYDAEIRLLRASVRLAALDLKAARRNLDLLNEEVLNGNTL